MGIVSTNGKEQKLSIVFNDDTLFITPEDGKEIAFPLLWHPKLKNASEEDKQQWTLSKDGKKIVWENLDVEITF